MIKTAALALGILVAPSAMAIENDSYEVCTMNGGCALMVQTAEYDGNIYLVKSESEYLNLSKQWPGARFYAVNETEYLYAKAELGLKTMLLPAKKGPGGGNPNGGPLVSGSITIGNISFGGNGGGTCGDCHKGNWHDIHKQIIKKPDDGGK